MLFRSAVANFRVLMLEEHKKHKRNAKRLAEACRDEWIRKQPKSEEELEAELRRAAELQYKSLVKTLQATWENVRAEINRRRLQEWEAAEQARVRKALNEAVDLSTQKLEARRATHQSSELNSEIEDDEDEEDGDADDSDSNMSSSESEAEAEPETEGKGGDEYLTVEELKAKYSNLPETPTIMKTEEPEEATANQDRDANMESVVQDKMDDADDSDESVDMEDDMGSSDEGQFSDEEDDEDDEEEDEDEASLLGFLGASDLAELGVNADDQSTPQFEDEDMLDEEDEVSLIPDASQPPTSAHSASVDEKSVTPPDADTKESVTEPGILLPRESREASAPRSDSELESKPSRSSAIPHPLSEVMTMDADETVGEDVAAGHRRGSADRSSQATPRTSITKHSDGESVSSLELVQQQSRQQTPSSVAPAAKTRTPIPFLLRGTLREYQHDGLDWLAGLYATNTNGILADEMGLGKTIQTIALLAHLACEHHVWGPHLVIVPTSVMLNWEMEFKKWCPGFKILSYYGTQDERKRKRQDRKSVV